MKLDWRLPVIVIVVGFFVGFGSGLVENDPGTPHIPENKYYGFPLVWRMVNTATGDKTTYPVELLLDVGFGILMAGVVALATSLTLKRMSKKEKASTLVNGKEKSI